MRLANEFIKFVVNELQLESLPKNIKFEGNEYSSQHLSFGTYNPMTDEIVVCKGDRHPVDVLRTLAHELVHHKQRQDGKKLDGNDGSDIENEANATAGKLMRQFRNVRPEMFSIPKVKENKVSQIIEVVKSGKPRKIDEHYVDKFTAKLLVTVMHKLSPENKEKFCNESVENMVAIAYKMVTK